MSNVTIQKRGKYYQYKFEIAKVDGKRKFANKSGFKTKAEAEREGIIAYNNYINTGHDFEPSDMSYSDLLDYWLEKHCYINLKYHTIEAYSSIVKNHIKPNIGFYKISQITRLTLQEFINNIYIKKSFSKNFLNNIKKVIISLLKDFADKNKIAVILVHHLRKQDDSDVFNKISGTAGIMGSSDTTFILEKKSRDDSVATLFVTGRDVEYQTFTLRFEDCRWNLIERSFQKELEMKNAPELINDVISFVNTNKYWQGTATELLSLIDKKDITPQYLTKVLNEYSKTILLDNKISFTTSRTSSSRLVTLEKDIEKTSEDNSTNDISIFDNVINDDDDAKNI